MTLDPGHCSPPRLKTVKPRPPHPVRQTAEASGFQAGSAGGGEGRAASRRNRSSEMAWRKCREGGENKARGYLRASADAATVVAAAAHHFGAQVPSWLPREPQPPDLVLGHGPLLPLTAQQAAAGDAATG